MVTFAYNCAHIVSRNLVNRVVGAHFSFIVLKQRNHEVKLPLARPHCPAMAGRRRAAEPAGVVPNTAPRWQAQKWSDPSRYVRLWLPYARTWMKFGNGWVLICTHELLNRPGCPSWVSLNIAHLYGSAQNVQLAKVLWKKRVYSGSGCFYFGEGFTDWCGVLLHLPNLLHLFLDTPESWVAMLIWIIYWMWISSAKTIRQLIEVVSI